MKLCKDCEWFDKRGMVSHSSKGDLCAHPVVLSPVHGHAHIECHAARMEYGHCGPGAEAFTPKQRAASIWKRIFG